MVISILMVIVGAVTIAALPVAQFPNIVPPEVQVLATYVGADAQTIEQSVATPIEQQMSGVDNMNYMYSLNSTADGLMRLIVDYDVKTDPNTDLMLTQMRQTQAASQLPTDVTSYGITVQKTVTAPLMLVTLYSPNGTYDARFLANYAYINLSDQINRSYGIGSVQIFGAGQYAITIFDSSRFIPGNLYDKIHHEFPGVTFVDHIGGDGRVKAEFKPNAIPFSVESHNATGLDTTVVEAAYLIDAAVLRAHVSTGVTLCAKNLFGATSINPDWHKNAHDGFPPNRDGSASYSAFADFLGHKDLGEKTMLFIIDGLYGNDNVDGPPHRKWKMAPFNDAWPNSILMSFDGVAIDSVGFDFLTSEWPDLPDIANADNYLRESALANDPPSKTVYDPERDGIRCRSLGVHEHWNNGTDKKYSRNLGKANGIELFQVS